MPGWDPIVMPTQPPAVNVVYLPLIYGWKVQIVWPRSLFLLNTLSEMALAVLLLDLDCLDLKLFLYTLFPLRQLLLPHNISEKWGYHSFTCSWQLTNFCNIYVKHKKTEPVIFNYPSVFRLYNKMWFLLQYFAKYCRLSLKPDIVIYLAIFGIYLTFNMRLKCQLPKIKLFYIYH